MIRGQHEKPKLVLKEHPKSRRVRNQHVEKAEDMAVDIDEPEYWEHLSSLIARWHYAEERAWSQLAP